MSDRREGFYWVKIKFSPQWEVAHFDARGRWFVTREEIEIGEHEFAEIDERRLERDEPYAQSP